MSRDVLIIDPASAPSAAPDELFESHCRLSEAGALQEPSDRLRRYLAESAPAPDTLAHPPDVLHGSVLLHFPLTSPPDFIKSHIRDACVDHQLMAWEAASGSAHDALAEQHRALLKKSAALTSEEVLSLLDVLEARGVVGEFVALELAIAREHESRSELPRILELAEGGNASAFVLLTYLTRDPAVRESLTARLQRLITAGPQSSATRDACLRFVLGLRDGLPRELDLAPLLCPAILDDSPIFDASDPLAPARFHFVAQLIEAGLARGLDLSACMSPLETLVRKGKKDAGGAWARIAVAARAWERVGALRSSLPRKKAEALGSELRRALEDAIANARASGDTSSWKELAQRVRALA